MNRLQKFAHYGTIASLFVNSANFSLALTRYLEEAHFQYQPTICIVEKYPIE